MIDYMELLPVITFLLISHSFCFIFLTVVVAKFYKEFYETIKRIA